MAEELQPDGSRFRTYWRYTVRLTTFTIVACLAVTCLLLLLSPRLNGIVVFGFPLGYSLSAQGAIVVFVLLVANYARRMNRADAFYGVREEPD